MDKGLDNRDFLSTLVGILLIPLLGVAAHYLTATVAMVPRWDFYVGCAILLIVSYFVSYIYYPKKRLKSFLAGVAAFIFISGFIGEFVPTAKKFEYPLIEKLVALTKLAGKSASADTLPEEDFRNFLTSTKEYFKVH